MDIQRLHKFFLDSTGVNTDSRSIQPGQLFFALKGENFDGHKFVPEVLRKGASTVVVSRNEFDPEKSFAVADTLVALQELAKFHRRQLGIPVIGITGSNGKTTTKELLTQVLNLKYRVHATPGNFNNHIGVPLTILGAGADTELLIVEMGANHIGEIATLCEISEPDYGLITSIGKAHIEGFGSFEGIIQGKTELYRSIRSRNKLLFYDNENKILISQLPDGVRAVPYLDELEFDSESFLLALGQVSDTSRPYRQTALVGNYNATNIRAAMTVGKHFGIPLETMISAICAYQPKNNRSQVIEKQDVTLVMDAYNANPTSMQASIKSLAETVRKRDKVLFLGDMKELGPESIALHKKVLDFAEQYEWKSIVLVGPDFASADATSKYPHYEDMEALSKSRKEILTMTKGAVCLIKASRSLRLEKIEALFDS